MTDLELASTNDLVNEIFRRHSYAIVCAGRPSKDGSEGEWLLRWSGPAHACLGASNHMSASLITAMVNAGRIETGRNPE